MQRTKPSEQLLKRTIQGPFLPSLVKIQPVVLEEMSFEAIVGPRGIICTNLVEVHCVMLPTKYQGSRPYDFRQKDFFMFFLI